MVFILSLPLFAFLICYLSILCLSLQCLLIYNKHISMCTHQHKPKTEKVRSYPAVSVFQFWSSPALLLYSVCAMHHFHWQQDPSCPTIYHALRFWHCLNLSSWNLTEWHMLNLCKSTIVCRWFIVLSHCTVSLSVQWLSNSYLDTERHNWINIVFMLFLCIYLFILT